jgi:hypothetical protein
MTQSTASNLLLQIGDCQERVLLPPTDANAEVKEIFSTASEKGDYIPNTCNRHPNEIRQSKSSHTEYDYHTFSSRDGIGRVS